MKNHHPVVAFDSIVKSFNGRPLLDGFKLNVEEGEFLTLLGPSGCGKTTLLRLLAGLESPDAGEILIDGQRVTSLPPERRNVNTVFQSYALFPHLSVFDNVAFGLRMKKVPAAEIRRRVAEALQLVRLAEYGERRPHRLSGGQQQRVALARALVNRPRVLLLDEPLSALDYKLRRAMQVELKELQRRLGITFLFVTHDQEEALSLSDRVVVMRSGNIEQIGTPQEIYQHPSNRFVAQFVGESNLLEGLACADASSAAGELSILLRPENLRLYAPSDPEARLQAQVVEKIYKGMVLDTVVELESGKRLVASGFFDQDYRLGQTVGVGWASHQEIVLPAGEEN